MDIVIVDRLFVGTSYATEVWSSDSVIKALNDLQNSGTKSAGIVAKLDYYASAGFRRFEGKHNPIRNENNGVWRIGLSGDLFRIIGFYTSDRKNEFIAIESFQKHGQKLRKHERKIIKYVAHIKRDELWEMAK